MFKRNEGILDRILRVVLGLLLLSTGLFLLGALRGAVPGLVAAGLGTLALLTGLTGVCPLYIPFGFSTLGKERDLLERCASAAASCGCADSLAGRMCQPHAPILRKPPEQQE